MDFNGEFVVKQSGKSRWFDKTPKKVTSDILIGLGEDATSMKYSWDIIHLENNRYETALTPIQITQVQGATAVLRKLKGY